MPFSCKVKFQCLFSVKHPLKFWQRGRSSGIVHKKPAPDLDPPWKRSVLVLEEHALPTACLMLGVLSKLASNFILLTFISLFVTLRAADNICPSSHSTAIQCHCYYLTGTTQLWLCNVHFLSCLVESISIYIEANEPSVALDRCWSRICSQPEASLRHSFPWVSYEYGKIPTTSCGSYKVTD